MSKEVDDNWHFGGGFAPYEETPVCKHTWILYEGLVERYYFCKNCDKKVEDL